MNDLLNTLFDLGELGFGAPDVALGFDRPLPRWGWMLVFLTAGLIGLGSYLRLRAHRPARGVLAVLRAALLLVIALLATGPHLVRQPIVEQRDAVLLMLDRSASMAVADAGPAREPREAQLARALESGSDALARLAQAKDLLWLGFDAGPFPLEPAEEGATLPVTLEPPAGRSTRIATSVEAGLRLAAGRPVAAVVLFSDGRSADTATRGLARAVAAERIPIISVPLGSADALPDVSIARVEAPDVVFEADLVPVRVTLQRSGPEVSVSPVGRVDLIDARTGAVIATEDVDPAQAGGGEPVLLLGRAQAGGEQRWRAVFVPAEADLIAANDAQDVRLRVADRPLRVLYLDGYPRWEQRYLTQLLVREQSVTVSSVLVAADRRYQQEGNERLATLPTTPEDWAPFDVVIIGDVRAETLGREQLAGLRAHVTERGAGLLWIAGPAATPQGWFPTPVGDLLPVRAADRGPGSAAAIPELWAEPVLVRPGDAARAMGLLTVGDPGQPAALPSEILSPELGWTALRWAQRLDPALLKPAVDVLAAGVPASDPASAGAPLVLSMRFGAGRVIYVGTDEVWRWRYGRGEVLFERFWLPLVRALGRAAVARDAGGATLRITPAVATAGRAAMVGLELSSPDLIVAAPPLVRVVMTPDGGGPGSVLELPRSDAGAGGIARYEGSWTPPGVGTWTAQTDEPLLAAAPPTAGVQVRSADDEWLRPQTDHALMADLAAMSDGAVLAPGDLARLDTLVPNRARLSPGPRDVASLWDKPVWLAVVLVLLGFEWVIRRLVKLA